MPFEPAGLPSRFTSLPTSPPRLGSRSSNTPNRNEPAPGAVYVTPPAVKVGPLTLLVMTHVGSPSSVGCVYVTQSMIFGCTGRRGGQGRVVEADPEVEDADGHAAAVPRGMGSRNAAAPVSAIGHVRVRAWRARARGRLRCRVGLGIRSRVGQRDEAVDLEGLDAAQRGCRVHPVAGDRGPDVVDAVFAVADLSAEAAESRHDRPAGPGLGGDEDGDRVLAVDLGFGDEGSILLRKLAVGSGGGDGLGQDGGAQQRHRHEGGETTSQSFPLVQTMPAPPAHQRRHPAAVEGVALPGHFSRRVAPLREARAGSHVRLVSATIRPAATAGQSDDRRYRDGKRRRLHDRHEARWTDPRDGSMRGATMTEPLTRSTRRATDRALLHRTADLAADFLESLDERPVAAAAGRDALLAALGGPLPARRGARDRGDRGPGPGRRPRCRGDGRPALLRVRDRWVVAGRARGGLDDLDLGPERRALRRRPGRVRRRGDRRIVAGGPPGSARGDEHRSHHRLPDGPLHVPRRRPSPGPGAGRLGRGGARPVRRAGDHGRASGRRRTRPCPTALQYLGLGRVPGRHRRLGRSGPDAPGCPGGGAPGRGRPAGRVPPGGQREHRQLRPHRPGDRSRPARDIRMRGSTSTAPSACGRPRVRTTATSWRATRAPTRGPRTATSG